MEEVYLVDGFGSPIQISKFLNTGVDAYKTINGILGNVLKTYEITAEVSGYFKSVFKTVINSFTDFENKRLYIIKKCDDQINLIRLCIDRTENKCYYSHYEDYLNKITNFKNQIQTINDKVDRTSAFENLDILTNQMIKESIKFEKEVERYNNLFSTQIKEFRELAISSFISYLILFFLLLISGLSKGLYGNIAYKSSNIIIICIFMYKLWSCILEMIKTLKYWFKDSYENIKAYINAYSSYAITSFNWFLSFVPPSMKEYFYSINLYINSYINSSIDYARRKVGYDSGKHRRQTKRRKSSRRKKSSKRRKSIRKKSVRRKH